MLSTAYYLWNILVLAVSAAANSEENLCNSNISWCKADMNEEWGYRGLTKWGYRGPLYWFLNPKYIDCLTSTQQSPIDIDTRFVVTDKNLSPLEFNGYEEPISQAVIKNNGHTIEVIPQDDVPRTMLVNGQNFSLVQFHFHWGCNETDGSEHTVDGEHYAMEIHFVHQCVEGFLAVLAVFVEEEEDIMNEEIEKVSANLPKYKNTEIPLDSPLNLLQWLPQNPLSMYRYDGSLTTPPCTDGVIWSVAKEPILVGAAQMEEFRKLYSTTEDNAGSGCKLSKNNRPVQPLNNRTVYESVL